MTLTSRKEIRENLQFIGNRIKSSFDSLTVAVTGDDGMTEFRKYPEFVKEQIRYHQVKNLENLRTYRALGALIASLNRLKEDLHEDIEKMHLLINQYSLEEAREAADERAAVASFKAAAAGEIIVDAGSSVEYSFDGVDLAGDAPATGEAGEADVADLAEPPEPRRGKAKGRVTDEEELDDDG